MTIADATALRRAIPEVTGILVRRGADFASAEDAVQTALVLEHVAGNERAAAFYDAVLGAARAVARARDLPCALGGGGAARLELDAFQPEGWEELLAAGSIARSRLSAAEAAEARADARAARKAHGMKHATNAEQGEQPGGGR